MVGDGDGDGAEQEEVMVSERRWVIDSGGDYE